MRLYRIQKTLRTRRLFILQHHSTTIWLNKLICLSDLPPNSRRNSSCPKKIYFRNLNSTRSSRLMMHPARLDLNRGCDSCPLSPHSSMSRRLVMQRRRWAESRSSGTTVAQAVQDSDRLRSGVRRLDLTCTPVYVRSTEGAHRHLGCANFVVGAVVWERFNKSKKDSVGCRPAVF
jgi:hypothetical protein